MVKEIFPLSKEQAGNQFFGFKKTDGSVVFSTAGTQCYEGGGPFNVEVVAEGLALQIELGASDRESG